MKYYCLKKGRYLKKREVKDKFHCERQNHKRGCVNLERRRNDGEIVREIYEKKMRLLRHQAANRIANERAYYRRVPEMQA